MKRRVTRCPCGSGQPATRCCLLYLKGRAHPPTAEALMRSRYTAFTRGNLDWLEQTHDPVTRGNFDAEETRRWNAGLRWRSLTVVRTADGGLDDDDGLVAFEAHFTEGGVDKVLSEVSRFRRVDGRWVYSGGVV